MTLSQTAFTPLRYLASTPIQKSKQFFDAIINESFLTERDFKEKTQHLLCCVGDIGAGIRSSCVAAQPSVREASKDGIF
jgi:hypothetical protein